MKDNLTEWVTKSELSKNLKISLDKVDKELDKLIDNKFVEQKGDKFRVNTKDGKELERIKTFLDGLDKKYEHPDTDKYYPIIRHGYLHLKHKLEEKYDYPEEVKRYSKKAGYDLDNIHPGDMLEDSALFEIDNKTIWILQATNNEIFERKMPYDKIVIDCDLEIDGKWFKGLLITKKGNAWTYWGNTDRLCDTLLIFDTFQPEGTKLEKHFMGDFDNKLNKSTIKKLKTFVCNFIDYLNNPEVRIIQIKRGKKNKLRRKKQGKEPLPSSNKIIVTGELKQYMEKISLSKFTYGHKFTVRGHFRRYWDKKKYNKLYNLLDKGSLPSKYYVDDKIRHYNKIITTWIKPFIKGSGILITKKYELKKRKR